MFNIFSEKLSVRLAEQEYRLTQPDAKARPVSELKDWAVWKSQHAGLVYVRVVDCDHADLPSICEQHTPLMQKMEENLSDYRSVMLLYVLVTEAEEPAEENPALGELLQKGDNYCGQPVYAMFWRVRLDVKDITVPEGQPSDIYGLREMVMQTLAETAATQSAGLSYQDAERRAEAVYEPVRKEPLLTYGLIVINAVVLLLMYLDGYANDSMTAMRFGAIVPVRVLMGQEYYRLFTSMFVHFGLSHFLMNTVGLLIFGGRVERYFGRVRFLLIYIFSGLCGSVFSLFLTRGYAAGASGAIYGLVGAAFVYARIYQRSLDRLDHYLMLIYIGTGLAMGFAMPGIDNFGHIGGLVMGLAAGRVLVPRKK